MKFKRIPVDKALFVQLSKRSNAKPLLDVTVRFGLIALTLYASLRLLHAGAYAAAVVPVLANGIFFSFLGWAGIGHELLHSTYFHNKPLNKVFLVICSVLSWNNWHYHAKSHQVHHVSTMVTGVDAEFSLNQPRLTRADVLRCLTFDYLGFKRVFTFTVQNAFGTIKGDWGAKHFPEGSKARAGVVRAARITLSFHVAVLLASVLLKSPLTLVISLAPFTCNLFSRSLTLAQHIGMKGDVDDFTLNSRTVLLPGFWSFLYCNMNYHVEHHMYPGIPYFNLPKVHECLIASGFRPETGMVHSIRLATT